MTTRKKTLLGLALALGLGRAGEASAASPAYVQLQVTFSGSLSVAVDGAQYSTRTLQGLAGATWGNPGPSAYAVPASSIAVVNNGTLDSRWELSASTVTPGGSPWALRTSTGAQHVNATNGGGQWACGTSGSVGGTTCPAQDQYAVQALFVSSATAGGAYGSAAACPAVNAADWDSVSSTVPATGSDMQYMRGQFAARYSPGKLANGGYDGPDSDITSISEGGTIAPANYMLPHDAIEPGTGRRALCVRVTMPSYSSVATQQTIQLALTAY